MTDKLLPCPFCATEVSPYPQDSGEGAFWIVCDAFQGGCGCEGPWVTKREEAAAAWNGRGFSPMSVAAAVVAEMVSQAPAENGEAAKIFNVAADDENGHSHIICVDWMTREDAEKVASRYRETYVDKPYPNGKGHYSVTNVRLINQSPAPDVEGQNYNCPCAHPSRCDDSCMPPAPSDHVTGQAATSDGEATASSFPLQSGAPLLPTLGEQQTLATVDQVGFRKSAKLSKSCHEISPAEQPVGCHPSHKTRFSDASSFDEVCTKCGATDIAGGGWGKLAEPCPSPTPGATVDE